MPILAILRSPRNFVANRRVDVGARYERDLQKHWELQW